MTPLRNKSAPAGQSVRYSAGQSHRYMRDVTSSPLPDAARQVPARFSRAAHRSRRYPDAPILPASSGGGYGGASPLMTTPTARGRSYIYVLKSQLDAAPSWPRCCASSDLGAVEAASAHVRDRSGVAERLMFDGLRVRQHH